MTGVARRNPQTTYVGLKNSLQQERALVQHVIPVIGMAFLPVKNELQDTFIQPLFKGATYQVPVRGITGLTVKQAGIALTDPTQTSEANYMASYVII